ncbi:DUF3050 domain-containing protein [Psychroserpens sp. NJDZ02]|uniref:DUF3050 domain-containing protein n=1 Tax=Psychroserpens sp. NJDZ02 TaxID=2570561 RepID=UPI0010A81FAA|nr:DUF3050 domain-containing protein [Psychroserpens sp. NJDZ02]QCE41679.1 DUF3050 domain-containing protein [Psychroserpens sp. NJDZ02]
MTIATLEDKLKPLRHQLNTHKLYSVLNNLEDVSVFMEQHVYAVWDFMSLLKALQNQLTTTTLPWVPVANPATARFINEIVLGEESDINELGEAQSHFEMYLEAMDQIDADTNQIQLLLSNLQNGLSVTEALTKVKLNTETLKFVKFTFEVIDTNEAHKIAAAFTFGREDVIPDMFFQIINQSKTNSNSYSKLTYYLKRHIELDGDEHGPLSLKMIEELCGQDTTKWNDVLEVSKLALQHRITLWDGIYNLITSPTLE